jgi:2'-hydroxyisoflavone reductase
VNLLVLGGTKFLGRAIVDAALGRGHDVTLFNRGLTNPSLYPGLTTIKGDRRTGGLQQLADRRFDAVVDVAAMLPEDVAPSSELLRGTVGRYVLISTLSVYADHGGPQVEGDTVLEQHEGQDVGTAYGSGKAAAERVVVGAFGDRALVVRPGLIVGPYDPTDRFAYWPRRMARGGRVLAPPRQHPTQFIDVRDLGQWIVHGVEAGLGGTFNATGVAGTMGDVIDACREVLAVRPTEMVWSSDEDLLATGLNPWMGLPLWIAAPGWEGASQADITRALANGLSLRPPRDTVRDTLIWDLARGGPPAGTEGLSAQREVELLESLGATSGASR